MNSNSWKINVSQLPNFGIAQPVVIAVVNWLNSSGFFPFLTSIILCVILLGISYVGFEACAFGTLLCKAERLTNILGGRRGDILSDDLACIGAIFFGLMILGIIVFYILMALYGGETIIDGIANVVQISFSWKLALFLLSWILTITLTKLALDMGSNYFGALAQEAAMAAAVAKADARSQAKVDAAHDQAKAAHDQADALRSIAGEIAHKTQAKVSEEVPKEIVNSAPPQQETSPALNPKIAAKMRAKLEAARNNLKNKPPKGQT